MTTWNPSDLSANITLSNGNLTATSTSTAIGGVRGNVGVTSGKYYWEYTCNTWGAPNDALGFATAGSTLTGGDVNNAFVVNSGYIYIATTNTGASITAGGITNGMVICVALDVTNKLVWLRAGAAGSWNSFSGSANNPATGTGGLSWAFATPVYPWASIGTTSGDGVTANFGASGFAGAVPAGYTPGFANVATPPASTGLPAWDVPTPTGTLQGAAAFSWDGAAWQPSASAGPEVGTPTGVLRGVAPFSYSGGVWTPTGSAGPDVATPTGTLDGVAVYTWNGSAWTPAPGGPDTATPTGTLQGIAAFYWDGTNWQPTGQAGPDVATPSGVLQGVAMFAWSGSAWAASAGIPPGVALDANFMVPGTLPTGVTLTRGSTATYFDATGTLQTMNGNLWLQSADASNAAWTKLGTTVAAPVVTANQTAAPDGTLTAARVVYPAVSAAGNQSLLYQIIGPLTATAYAFSLYMRGNVGGEQLYLGTNFSGAYQRQRVTLTTAWQRFVFLPTGLAAGNSYVFDIGTDLGDPGQTSTSAQTVFMWGAQVEVGSTATYYSPTTTVATNNAPRWDYNPSTHALNGLLIEEARTNLLLNSATLGTQSVTTTATATTLSFYGTGSVTYSGTAAGTLNGAGAFPQRASVTFTPTAGTLTCTVTGSVLNAQLEAGAFPTSYIPTTAATVTRSQEQCSILPAGMGFYTPPGGSWAAEFIELYNSATSQAVVCQHNNVGGPIPVYSNASNHLGQWDGTTVLAATNFITVGAVSKGATTWVSGTVTACLNAGAVASSATAGTGYPLLATAGVDFLRTNEGGTSQMRAGYIRRVRYWPRVLSNTELQQVTT